MGIDIKLFYSGPMSVNSYLVADETTKKGFLVDPGGPNPNMDKYVEQNQYDIEYIILTHGHGDHICGVLYYKEKYGAKIVGHKADDFLFLSPGENLSIQFVGRPIIFTPDIYVADGDELQIGEMKLKFLHTPGHTPGGICILLDNVLFSGDTLFAESIGRTDFKGGSFPQLRDSIHKKLFVLPDDTYVLPGHMGQTTIGHEKGHNPFV